MAPLAVAALVLAGCSGSDSDDDSGGDAPGGQVGTSSESDADDSDSDDSGDDESGDDESGDDDECYFELFDADDLDDSDDTFKLTDPGEYENLEDLPGADDDWTDEADSARVGESATVEVWSETDFEGDSSTLDPGSEHPDLDPEPSSLKMTC